jgi:hypothetical protein
MAVWRPSFVKTATAFGSNGFLRIALDKDLRGGQAFRAIVVRDADDPRLE